MARCLRCKAGNEWIEGNATMSSEEKKNKEAEQLAIHKNTLNDIRYILRRYKKDHPEEAWECIEKLANNPRLRLKDITITPAYSK